MGGSHLCSGTFPLKLKCTYSGLGQEELEGSYCLLNLELTTFNKTNISILHDSSFVVTILHYNLHVMLYCILTIFLIHLLELFGLSLFDLE